MSVFYQSEIVEIIPSGNESSKIEVPNLQSSNVSFNVQRTDVTRLAKFSPMPYRPSLQHPLVNFQAEFIPTGNNFEAAVGLTSPQSLLQNLVKENYEFFPLRVKIREMFFEGQEHAQATMFIESGALTNYSFQASVGQIPRVSFSVEGTDLGVNEASFSVGTPNDDFPVVRPQDITTPSLTGIFGVQEAHVQSFSVNVPLPRTPLYKLGEKKPFARKLQAPVIATIQFNAIMSDFSATTQGTGVATSNTDQMNNLTCGQRMPQDLEFTIYRASCNVSGEKTNQLIKFTAKKPYLDSWTVSNSVGGYTSVDVQLSVPVSPVDDGYGHTSGESNLIIT